LAHIVGNNLVFFVAVFVVPKINIQIGTEQELEEVDVKYFGMAPPARLVFVYSGTLIMS
jgi:hypothetical protein